MTSRSKFRRTCFVLATALAVVPSAWAQGQDFPNRPITIIVPYPAGGIVDSVTRVLAEQLSRELGQQVNVDPRPGGNANIGTLAGLRAAPDGYTWTFAATALTANPSLYKGLWDPLKDAVGVGVVVTAPSLLAVPSGLAANTVKELVELANKQPGKLNFGNPGNGTSQHLNHEMFRQRADIQLAAIPYKGQPQVLQDMLRGDVQFSLFSLGIAAPQLTAGKIKALAVVSDTRVPSLPEVPTLAEAGYPSANLVPWYGYVVPAATPKAVVARINQAINAALQVPPLQARLRAMGATPQAPRSVEQINAMIRSDYDTFRAAILAGNITAE